MNFICNLIHVFLESLTGKTMKPWQKGGRQLPGPRWIQKISKLLQSRRAHSWFWHSVAGLHPLAKYGLVPHSVGTMWETHISSAAAIVLSWYYQDLQLVHLKQSLWAWRSFGSAGLPSVGAPQLGGTHVTSLHTVQLFCEQYCDSV